MDTGERFESYVLREKIGAGGMADVFRAERVGAMGISRVVCIKRIRQEHCRDDQFVRMFTDEARISSTLRHGNIVAVEHFGAADGVLFMAMEWVQGTDAAKLLDRSAARGERLPIDAVTWLLAEVLEALEYAHGKTEDGQWLQIVHRDVSPDNMMVSFSGEVKLTDFGIAKATSRMHPTQGHVIKGKLEYMAPEQALGAAVDHRADLFALGAVAYELLSGRLPFQGSSPTECVMSMLQGDRPALRALRPEVSPELEAFVDTLLAHDPERRFSDASAARDALQTSPGLVTGQRSLQRVLRELFPEAAASNVVPRRPGHHAAKPARLVTQVEPRATADDTTGPIVAAVATAAHPRPRGRRGVTLALAAAAAACLALSLSLAPTHGAPAPDTRARIALAAAPVTRIESLPEAPRVAAPAPPAPLARVVAAPAAAPAPTAPRFATLTVVAVPWGTITVDGKTPRENRGTWRLVPGPHRVAVTRGGFTYARTVAARAGANPIVQMSSDAALW
jgi:serine/threonine protein kinase